MNRKFSVGGDAPWWIDCVGMFLAIVVAKHLYGGLGHNVFNPAMVGCAVVLLSFPQAMTQWLPSQSISPADIAFLDDSRPGHSR